MVVGAVVLKTTRRFLGDKTCRKQEALDRESRPHTYDTLLLLLLLYYFVSFAQRRPSARNHAILFRKSGHTNPTLDKIIGFIINIFFYFYYHTKHNNCNIISQCNNYVRLPADAVDGNNSNNNNITLEHYAHTHRSCGRYFIIIVVIIIIIIRFRNVSTPKPH